MLQRQSRQIRLALARRSQSPVLIELHPFAAAALVVAGLLLVGWSAATTSYAVFRDEFLQQMLVRHSAAERASSVKIDRLLAELDQVKSRLLIEREGFAEQFEQLSRRQAEVERRQRSLSGLGNPSSFEPGTDLEGDGLRLGDAPSPTPTTGLPDRRPSADQLSKRYDAIERGQQHVMALLKSQVDTDRKRLVRVYAGLGMTPSPASPIKAGFGGLYLPFRFGEPNADSDLEELKTAMTEANRLRAGLDRIPVRSPVPGSAVSGGFGNRPDPFLGTLAFHSGLDLAASLGSPALATADGTVISAGWEGGYGLMVEIRHANGYSTRYAHLSSVSVTEGQDVRAGAVIGRVGSTGRSTGPHLHYETRLNETPLNPRRFLAAGALLD